MTNDHFAPVSVVIPCFCCAKTIGRAVASIQQQSVIPAQVILVDDASGDLTLKVLSEIEKKYLGWVKVIALDVNRGPSNARNTGWRAAAQPLIAFLDADDTWHPKKIELQYAYMVAHPEIVLSGHGFRMLPDQNSYPDWPVTESGAQEVTKWSLLVSNRFITPSVMLRKDISQRFRLDQWHMEDHLLWLEILCDGGQVAKLSAELAAIYKQPFGVSGLSSQMWKMEKGDLRNYRILYRSGSINGISWLMLSTFSWIKFIRRLIIYLSLNF